MPLSALSTTEAMDSDSPLQRYDPLTCDVLLELRATGEYCDATLRTDDQHLFQVHRALLCGKSRGMSREPREDVLLQPAVRFSVHCSPTV